jgi:hypothetical protein
MSIKVEDVDLHVFSLGYPQYACGTWSSFLSEQ